MENAKPRSSWLGRNWIWALPLGCLTLLALFLASIAALVVFVFGFVTRSDVYQHALSEARSSPALVEALGEPVEPGWYVTGTINVTGASGNADSSFPIPGPKGSGTLYVSARKRAGVWSYDLMEVALDEGGGRIDLRAPP